MNFTTETLFDFAQGRLRHGDKKARDAGTLLC